MLSDKEKVELKKRIRIIEARLQKLKDNQLETSTYRKLHIEQHELSLKLNRGY